MERAVVSVVLSTFRDLLLEEGRFLYRVRGEVRLLQTQLTEIQCLLDDAERTQAHKDTKTPRNWITQIRDLAHRAEDAILTYISQVYSRRGHRIKQRLRRCSCIFCECCSLHQIGTEISEIKSELERVTKSMHAYGLKNIIESSSATSTSAFGDNQPWKRLAFPFETEDCFIGKEEELKQLLSLVIEDKQRGVIALWGSGGIGKTTIAKKVYNHIRVKFHFECYAWVFVSQQCQIRSIFEDVLKQLTRPKKERFSNLSNTDLVTQLTQRKEENFSNLSDIELVAQLRKRQESKRCIIVLDDLWKIPHWDGLKQAFLFKGSKSKIMFTTRNQNIAKLGHAFEVGLLNMDDGWELLKKKAFTDGIIPTEFVNQANLVKKIGEEMVHRCSYLPLVILTLGGVLSKRKSIEEWESVKKNIRVYLDRGEGIDGEEGIHHQVLRLSYDDLPYYLKPCFLYMGHFLEGEIIQVEVLYRRWIAQGMVSHDNQGNDETSMDIATLYLSELASRCIVQVEVQQGIQGQIYRTCKLHHVIRDLCLSLGRKEEFGLKIFDYHNGRFSTLLRECLLGAKTRHLTIYFRGKMEPKIDRGDFTISSDTVRYVRSLAFCNISGGEKLKFPHTILDLHKFKFLRELSFVNFVFPQRKLPAGIGSLIHLRYLFVRACELDKLPASISNLVYLCTLQLSESWNIRVPNNVLKKMYRLKHLLLPFYEVETIGDYRLRLDEGLDELETLVGFDSMVHEFKAITRLKNLRRFGAVVRDNKSLSAIIDAIDTNWKHLRFSGLTVTHDCKFTSEDELVLLKKVFACRKLHQMEINSPMLAAECRTQIVASNLKQLTLFGCEIEDDPMEIFGMLPFLGLLRLLDSSFKGERMKCSASGFPRLKMLIIAGLLNLREWRVEEGAMPLVSEIRIFGCPSLKTVPDGLRFIRDLQTLVIVGMPELGNRVEVEGEDFDEVRHVPSVIISNN